MAKPRKKGNRVVKPKIYIFCEGEKTEPSYIRAYINFKYPSSVRLRGAERPVILKDTDMNTPIQLVEVALEHKKSLDFEKDQVWVMYDRESPQKYTDEQHRKAYDEATRNGLNVAISNVCFEYWLLLHLSTSAPAMSNCDALVKSPAFREALLQLGMKQYDKKGKTAKELFTRLMSDDYINAARNNAKNNNENAMSAASSKNQAPYQIQPFTNVYELLEAIDEVAAG